MNMQSLPWVKFGYTDYEQSEFRASASLLARLAMLELTLRSSRTHFKLPKNDAALAHWAGLSKAQWAKVKDTVVSQFEDHGDHYLCSGMAALYDTEANTEPSARDSKPAKAAKTPAERKAAQRDRQRDSSRKVSRDVTPDVTKSHAQNVTSHGDVTKSHGKNVTFEGGKGGDLDLEQELDQEVKKRSSSACEQASAGAKEEKTFSDSLPDFTAKKSAPDQKPLSEFFPDRPALPPAQWLTLARADYPQADHTAAWVKFRNHFWSKTGDCRTYADWEAAYLGWIGRENPAKAANRTAPPKGELMGNWGNPGHVPPTEESKRELAALFASEGVA